jgi:quercetin dioxygenase-like cupin family protein
MKTDLEPFTLEPQDGEFRWGMDGSLSRFIANGEELGGAYAVVEDLAARSEGIPLHRHPGDNETFYVLQGEIKFFIGSEEPFVASERAVVFVPGEVAHAFQVTSETARYLIITTPRHADFYRAISRSAPSRNLPLVEPLDMEVIMQACEQFGVEILGPPPGQASEVR